MEDLLEQIERALQANLYYVALFTTLCIPDICAALSTPDGQTTGKLYERWFDQYVAPKCYGVIDGETCYYYRCSLLHQGTSQHPKNSYSRIIFLEPSQHLMHCNTMNDALNIDVRRFCLDIIAGAREWLLTAKGTPTFQQNFSKFVRRHPQGLSPYIAGVPVIG